MNSMAELEMKILGYGEAQGKGNWRPARTVQMCSEIQESNERVLTEALKDLCDRSFLEIRKWGDQNDWVWYLPGNNDFQHVSGRDFNIKVTHAGRKHFEMLVDLKNEEKHIAGMLAPQLLAEAKFHQARTELQAAHEGLNKRPEPDLTGAVQHAIAALECTARELSGEEDLTLGKIIDKHSVDLKIPKLLDQSLKKCWQYASDTARHVREGRPISFPESAFIVSLSDAMIVYLLRKNKLK